jgi:ABC-type nickel/cobalt efflux system permease component RcnA
MPLAIDLWNPHAGLALWAVLVTSLLLGMVHGVTPDEHTWPITFSYAVAGYSARRGMRAGLTFSLAFTLQRALASELAYLALARYLTLGSRGDYIVYVLVGIAMIWAATYIAAGRLPWHVDVHLHGRRSRPGAPERPAHLHLHPHGGVALERDGAPPPGDCPGCHEPDLREPSAFMPALHGFIAGFGFGAFAVIVYTVLAPSMPSAALGWVPGALFGLGTTLVQVAVGGLVGHLMRRKGASEDQIRRVGLVVATRTLGIGGAAFVLGGAFGLSFPHLAALSVSTGLHVHNLAHLGLPLVLVVVTVGGVGVGTLVSQLHRLPPQGPASGGAAPP